MDNKMSFDNSEIVKKTMKKARRKMNLRIAKIVILCFAVIVVLFSLPSILYSLQVNRITDTQKMAMLALEYTTPNSIVGYSVSFDNPVALNKDVSIYYRNYAGHNIAASDQDELHGTYNLLSGKLSMYTPFSGKFLHPDRYNNMESKYQHFIDKSTSQTKRALEKNLDSTVTLLNVTFKDSHSLLDVIEMTKDLDLEINWYAIETGLEGQDPPKNMGMPAQQYYTFGIPTEIYRPETIFDPITMDPTNVNKQIDMAIDDLQWMKDNKDLLKKEFWFLDESVTITSYNVKCYGIQVNGPTDQIYELTKRIDYLYLNLEEMSLWFW